MLAATFASLRGAPGATTAAAVVQAAWPIEDQRAVLVEADPDGGVAACRWGFTESPSMIDLVIRPERGMETAAQRWNESAGVVVAPSDTTSTVGALVDGGARLSHVLGDASEIVIADVGRLSPTSPALPLAVRSACCALVVRRRLDHLAGISGRAAALTDVGVTPRLVVVGDGPYRDDEIEGATGIDILGTLPHDERGAAALWNGDNRRLRRSLLWREARVLADTLADALAHDRPLDGSR